MVSLREGGHRRQPTGGRQQLDGARRIARGQRVTVGTEPAYRDEGFRHLRPPPCYIERDQPGRGVAQCLVEFAIRFGHRRQRSPGGTIHWLRVPAHRRNSVAGRSTDRDLRHQTHSAIAANRDNSFPGIDGARREVGGTRQAERVAGNREGESEGVHAAAPQSAKCNRHGQRIWFVGQALHPMRFVVPADPRRGLVQAGAFPKPGVAPCDEQGGARDGDHDAQGKH